jgi:hypothetical protein
MMMDAWVEPSDAYLYETTGGEDYYAFSVDDGDFLAAVDGDGIRRVRISVQDRSIEVEGEPSEGMTWLRLDQDVFAEFVIVGNSEGDFSVVETGDVVMIEGLYGEQNCCFFHTEFSNSPLTYLPYTFTGKNYFDLSDLETEGVVHFCDGKTNEVIKTVSLVQLSAPEA